MYLLVAVLFAILYGVITAIGFYMGVGGWLPYALMSVVMVLLQYMLGPTLVQHMMHVRWVSAQDEPELHKMVAELAEGAGLRKPRVGISEMEMPNAFAFGRSRSSGNICVTRGILRLLNRDELRAVLGHEMSHIRNRDMMIITLLSVIPMIMYQIAWITMWSGMLGGRREGNGGIGMVIGMGAFLVHFITNLLVLYGSRIREYGADRGAVQLGGTPSQLASALYKLSYGSARMRGSREVRETEGARAFFISDPMKGWRDVNQVADIDVNRNGIIEPSELIAMREKQVRISGGEKMLEIFTTHPNMLKRIKHLALLQR